MCTFHHFENGSTCTKLIGCIASGSMEELEYFHGDHAKSLCRAKNNTPGKESGFLFDMLIFNKCKVF